jgi:PLP dependent protein
MHGTLGEISANLAEIRRGIASACDRADRDPADVLLVAAAKSVPAEMIGWVVDQGVTAVGENYVKELREKHGLLSGVAWHFIGTLQTNTAHHVAELADVVETLSGARASQRLARRAAEAGRVLDALIEVDLTGMRTGVAESDAAGFADGLAELAGLNLVGLMTLPPMPESAEDCRPAFIQLRELRDRIREKHPGVLELSMGMSLDYEVAVEEGATMVRIGTALFGSRAM